MRQFIADQELDKQGMLVLSGKAYTYLAKVRRIQESAVLPVVLPISGYTEMTVHRIDTAKRRIILTKHGTGRQNDTASCCADTESGAAVPEVPAETEAASCKIILLQWVLKGEKNNLVVRQATETGVHIIFPVHGVFSVAKKHGSAQQERFRRIIKEARQQSGSPIQTEIREPAPLEAVLAAVTEMVGREPAFFAVCTEKGEQTVSLHQGLAHKPAYIVLAIGAEGGISPDELRLLTAVGFQPVHFNTNVLRAETAALYAIAAAQTIMNEANQWQLPVYAY